MTLENREPLRSIREEDFAEILREAEKTDSEKAIERTIETRLGEDQLEFGFFLIDNGLGLVVSKFIDKFSPSNREIIVDKLIETFSGKKYQDTTKE